MADPPLNALGLALRAELRGHTDDVRALTPYGPAGLATASRDKTLKLWAPDSSTGRGFTEGATLCGHTDFVTAVAAADATLVSGSRDTTAIVWDAPASEPAGVLKGGHAWAVSAVAVAPGGRCVFTASLDGSVKAWPLGAGVAAAAPVELGRHDGPVQCLVLVVHGSDAVLVSGSSDRSAKAWAVPPGVAAGVQPDAAAPSPPTPLATLAGHTDTVRGLSLMPRGDGGVIRLATASHDGTLRVWGVDPAALGFGAPSPSSSSAAASPAPPPRTLVELVGHTALVYAVSAHPTTALLASASEDETVRVWDGEAGAALAVLPHPGCCWAVGWVAGAAADAASSFDVATGCGDGVARLWTSEPGRAAPPAEVEAFEAALAARAADKAAAAAAAASQGAAAPTAAAAPGLPPGLRVDPPDALLTPGDKEGATKIVAEPGGAGPALYEWSAAGGWAKVGDLVPGPDGPDGGGGGVPAGDTLAPARKWHGGRAWDYVFDVDVKDGAPPLKLPYDRAENPYAAADRFLSEHGLPQAYREQVVAHILSQTGGGSAGAFDDPLAANVDPFTGGGAYVPGTGGVGAGPGAAAPAAPAPGAGSADPFTGAGAYVPPLAGGAGRAAPAPAPAGGGGFELTGGGADPFTGAGAVAAPAPAPPPRRAFTLFDAPPAKPAALAAKLRSLLEESGAADLARAVDLDGLAAAAAGVASHPDGPPPPPAALTGLRTLLSTAPPSALFPVLDCARCVGLHPVGAAALAAGAGEVDASDRSGALGRALAAALAGPAPPPPAVLVAARALANTARHPTLRNWAAARAGAICDVLAGPAGGAGAAPAALAAWGAALSNLALALEEQSDALSPDARDAAALQLASAAAALAVNGGSGDAAAVGLALAAAASAARASAAVRGAAADLGFGEAVAAGKAAGGVAAVQAGEVEEAVKG